MIAGFTGTQNGMTDFQNESVKELLEHHKFVEAHHGDCLGSDAEFHDLCLSLHIPVITHPPIKSAKRAFCKGAVEEAPKKDYLERDRDIAVECDVLIATPKEFKEQLRSGTWTTVRYAKKLKKRIIIVFPDGTIKTI